VRAPWPPRRRVASVDARADGVGVSSIQEINQLPREMAEGLYARLVPDDLLTRFAIDPQTLKGPEGTRLVRITAPADKPWARVEVRSSTEDRDPALLVDVEMSARSVPALAFVQITNPRSARYGIDRDPEGRDTLFGTVSRNVDEEIRARSDGLAPGQVRRGLTMLPKVLEAMDGFCRLMGTELYLIEPLFYHSAILYERHGCGYLLGREVMEAIHDGFAVDGPLAAGLDSSSPFRLPAAADTVRGRSWALHDGLAPSAWGGVKMYRVVGRPAGISTFPGGIY
jgi:hypothetical protein